MKKQRGDGCGAVSWRLHAVMIGVLVFTSQIAIRAADENAAKVAIKQLKIDLDKTVELKLPNTTKDLVPIAFKSADERDGWVIRLPGNRPIATPAYADGRIFVGGGYGSHEFYAFDARTGAKIWEMKTSDDGPTAAVVEDGCVAFNTESCTVIVTDAKTGKLLWLEWLGDPLMSQPAIAKGKLYMAHPAGGRHASNSWQSANNSAAQSQPTQSQSAAAATKEAKPSGQTLKGSHRLLCADLKTGKHFWEAGLSSDVISAPVIEGDQVFLTCLDGTSYCFNAEGGNLIWQKANAGTSAPLLAAGKLVMTQKRQVGAESQEGLVRVDPKRGETEDKTLLAGGKADYLRPNAEGNVALKGAHQKFLDSSVGFGAAPAAANLSEANNNLGVKSVVAGWAYQGSRAAYSKGSMFNARGNFINCVQANNGELAWQATATGKNVDGNAQIFAPPALGQTNMYLCSADGHLLGLQQKDGAVIFAYQTKAPIAFQPALAEGRIFAGTADGRLICINLKDKDADGWYAWGGNAQHNKKL